jgi:hypothetical protein
MTELPWTAAQWEEWHDYTCIAGDGEFESGMFAELEVTTPSGLSGTLLHWEDQDIPLELQRNSLASWARLAMRRLDHAVRAQVRDPYFRQAAEDHRWLVLTIERTPRGLLVETGPWAGQYVVPYRYEAQHADGTLIRGGERR